MIVVVPVSTTGPVSVIVGGQTSQGPVFTYAAATADDSVMVSTVAGSGVAGHQDGVAGAASFNFLNAIAADKGGNVFVAEDNYVRKITPAGVVTTLSAVNVSGHWQADQLFSLFEGITFDQYDTLFVSSANGLIFTLYNGGIGVLAGDTAKSTDGNWEDAVLTKPKGMAVDKNGNVYVADQGNNAIKKITPDGWISILAGGSSGVQGGTDGKGLAAGLFMPTDVAIGNDGNIYVVDAGDFEIRKITPDGVVTTLAGNTSGRGAADGVGAAGTFNYPVSLTIDSLDNIYVVDFFDHTVRKVTPAGVVTTIAGTGQPGAKDGPGKTATFDQPSGITIDRNGNLYVADGGNYKVRKIVISHSK